VLSTNCELLLVALTSKANRDITLVHFFLSCILTRADGDGKHFYLIIRLWEQRQHQDPMQWQRERKEEREREREREREQDSVNNDCCWIRK
jgi:hypothetical protein